MDPYSTSIPPPPQATLSATFPFSFEPNNHIFPAVNLNPNPNPNPTPPPPPAPAPAPAPAPPVVPSSPALNHPPYAEMIYTAIGALKEKDGSSKRAIGKYIEQVYKDHLPPTHSTLLTQHLKLLKSNGLLVMVKKSYQLPRSLSQQPLPLPPPSLPQNTPRSRGRPPKPKPQPHPQPQQQNAEPVWVALGLSDEPAPATTPELKKRGRGRPRKIIGIQGVGPALPLRIGRPPKRIGRPPKRLGRSPKPKSLSAISNGLKRRPGRPPKIHSNPTIIPFAASDTLVPAIPPTEPTASVPIGSPRPRGRPRKNVAALSGAQPIVGVAAPRGRGRRGRGRGRWGQPEVGRPKNPTGRPVGRPKGSTVTAAQKVANEDLRRKLEYCQSKVKESLGVLKPYFNHESPVTAIAAIQELEILATLDLDAPLRDETQQLQQLPQQLPPQQQLQPQQLPPQQLLLPLPHIYQQQYPQIPLQAQLQQLFQPHTSAQS